VWKFTTLISIPGNNAPALNSPGNKTVDEGVNLSFTLSSTEPDGDNITYSMVSSPVGATLTGAEFSWTPTFDQSNTYNITFVATDDGTPNLSDTVTISIIVNDYFIASESGTLVLSYQAGQMLVYAQMTPPTGNPIYQYVIQRRIEGNPTIETLDTIPNTGWSNYLYTDTIAIYTDKYVYYRQVAQLAATEQWLSPSSWDSILVDNETWNYLPIMNISRISKNIDFVVTNPVALSFEATYYLYRNSSSSTAGKVLVDSLAPGQSVGLMDTPASVGTYYYWIEVEDQWNRRSIRSLPQSVVYTGKLYAPTILSVVPNINNSQITILVLEHDESNEYVLERVRDTTDTPLRIDTVFSIGVSTITFTNTPPQDGFWYYRALVVDAQGNESNLSQWQTTSSEFIYQQQYLAFPLFFPAPPVPTIENLGDKIASVVTRDSIYSYYLWRSDYSTMEDSILVDSLIGNDPSKTEVEDVPAIGTYYYWVERKDAPWERGDNIYRTNVSSAMVFTNNWPGPVLSFYSFDVDNNPMNIQARIVSNTYYDVVIFQRTADTNSIGSEVALDTIDVLVNGSYIYSYDIPEVDGTWFYRAQWVKNGELSEFGGWQSIAWVYVQRYTNQTLSSTGFINRGDHVVLDLNISSTYQHSVYRNTTPVKPENPTYTFNGYGIVNDTLPADTYYYWVEAKATDWERGDDIFVYPSSYQAVAITGVPLTPTLTLIPTSFYVRLAISFNYPNELTRIRIESAQDTNATLTLDTLSIVASSNSVYDRPDTPGIWWYRVIGDYTIGGTTPYSNGSWISTTWSPSYTTSSTYATTPAIDGATVTSTTTFNGLSYYYRMMRNSTNNILTAYEVDRLDKSTGTSTLLFDTPPTGTWYYWVLQVPYSTSSGTTYTTSAELIIVP